MRILGLNNSGWITSAALVKDGRIIAAAAEERFDRLKRSRAFPHQAIQSCLNQESIQFESLDCVAVGWNPGVNLERFNARFSGSARWMAEYLYSVPNNLLRLLENKKTDYIEQRLPLEHGDLRIFFINHHLCHAAFTFCTSSFRNSAILSVDGFGERSTALWATGEDHRIKVLRELSFPQSLGSFYSTFTEFLGYRADSDEWKIMGGAPYGDSEVYYKTMRSLVELRDDGMFELDLSPFNYYNFDQTGFYNEKMIRLFGKPRKPDDPMEQRHFDLAAALQQVTEEIIFHMARRFHDEVKLDNICLCGGSFMNSVLNGKMAVMTPFKNVYIPPAADDSGNAVGAALYLYHQILDNRERYAISDAYWGPQWSREEIEKELRQYRLSFESPDDLTGEVARYLAEGKVVAWFQGRMEFGQRALGNRSILADPRDSKMKDRLNESVKFRESFRPFAPVIPFENLEEYFEMTGEVPFMEKVVPIKPGQRSKIAAVNHVDGTGRVQTVKRIQNPLLHDLLKSFEKITGIPVLLNTSFNLAGEPIVCSPKDAIRTFYTSGIDVLVMGHCILIKNS